MPFIDVHPENEHGYYVNTDHISDFGLLHDETSGTTKTRIHLGGENTETWMEVDLTPLQVAQLIAEASRPSDA